MKKTIENSYAVDGVDMIKKVRKTINFDGDFDGVFLEALLHVCMIIDNYFKTNGEKIAQFRQCSAPEDFYVLGGAVLLQAEIMLYYLKGEMENEKTDNSND